MRFRRSTASRRATSPTAIASWRRRDPGPPLRRLRRRLENAKVVLDADRRKRHHPRTTPATSPSRRASSWSRTRPAGGGRRPGRMAGRADRRIRRGVPGHPAGGHPRHHPRQPEMLRAARSGRASSPTASSSSPTSRRATAARRSPPATGASCARACRTRCYFWETDRSRCPTTRQGAKPLDQRLAKLEALNIVFHEKLGTQGERVDAHRARWRRRSRRWSAPIRAGRARRASPRPISSPRWSASFPSCRA